MNGKKLYILKMGSTYQHIKKKYGDFEDWIIKKIDNNVIPLEIIDVRKDELPDIKFCKGVIVTGAHEMVTDNHPWSVRVEKWIPKLLENEIPYLGICYGHQLLAKAIGGYVDFNPEGEKFGTIMINLTNEAINDSLFSKMPEKFFAHVSHSQIVFDLPEEAEILAYDKSNIIYSFRIGKCAWGVQFHPEFDENIMREYSNNELSINEKDNRLASSIINLFVEMLIPKISK